MTVAMKVANLGLSKKAVADGIIEKGVKTTIAVKVAKEENDLLFIKALASELKIMIYIGQHCHESSKFGIVKKAVADGIIEKGVKTTVAVKVAKEENDSLFIEALASELKIMIYIGQHCHESSKFGIVKKAVADGIIEKGVKTTVAVKVAKEENDSLFIKALASELKIMSILRTAPIYIESFRCLYKKADRSFKFLSKSKVSCGSTDRVCRLEHHSERVPLRHRCSVSADRSDVAGDDGSDDSYYSVFFSS
ncbi:receptor protein-tyrosine kinase [Sarracenia purpurea var. burkii]